MKRDIFCWVEKQRRIQLLWGDKLNCCVLNMLALMENRVELLNGKTKDWNLEEARSGAINV